MKRPGGGKAKGSSFEREICNMISLWWSRGTRIDLCWRSASSGARGTITKTKTIGYHGDLVAVDDDIKPLFKKFCFECKSYKDLQILSLFKDVHNQLFAWWKQATKEAIQSNRQPILIFKINTFPIMLVCKSSLFFRDSLDFIAEKKFVKFIGVGNKLMICRLQDAFASIDLEKFKEWLQK
jgi:hypothetical protein